MKDIKVIVLFLGKSGLQIISEKAKSVLESLVGNNVEFLPLIHKASERKILCYSRFTCIRCT